MSSADSGGTETQPADDPSGTEGATEQAAAPVDEARQAILETLRRELGDAIVGSEIAGGDIWVRVDRSAWRRAGEVCQTVLGMHQFCFLSGLDWLPSPDMSAEKVWDPEAAAATEDGDAGWQTGVAGGETRFQVFARVYNTDTHVGITLKADLDEADPRVDSWIPLFRGADWHEREAWEMYGFTFDGHPDLRHIYLPAAFEGFPLRKDFPLLAREVKPWPGLVDKEPIPGEGEEDEAEGDGA